MSLKTNQLTRLVIGVFLVFISLPGCSESNSESSQLDAVLDYEGDQLPVEGGQYVLTIQSNAYWTVEVDADWVSASPRYGSGNDEVMVTVNANEGKERSTYLKVATVDKTEQIRLLQKSAVEEGDNGGNTGLGDITKRIEVPRLSTSDDAQFIAHKIEYSGKTIANLSLEYSKKSRHARWAAFTYYNETAANRVQRTDAWADDPEVAPEHRSQRSDFYGYHRGHIVASSDRVYDKRANEQTFYYSNISPMIGNFNVHTWTQFEGAVRNWGRSSSFRDTLYVVKGGTLDKVIRYTTTPAYVPVPKYYFMALVNYKGGEYSGLAFWIEHRDYGEATLSIGDYAITIDELEQKTGFDFFHNLPDDIENEMEKTLEKYKWEGL
ncbi:MULTISPECIES: DNA/RNA non-specific endonuclease [unclassified Carboxylicivirga]|uniref:DNA/RNA non-specific endonuclease n=1 Tax=Carboxylicivirga TaxID=1628153 RepID=UPI003D35868F